MQFDFLIYIAAFLAVLGILVTVHEFGHYLIARWSGVQVLKFSVGFGRNIWSKTDKHGTEFAIAAIPLGGYVRMYDDRDPSQSANQQPGSVAFMDLHPAWRIAIALGGPVANFILAIFVYWILLVAGVMSMTPMLGLADADTPLAQAGHNAPGKIVAVDGKPVDNWQDIGLALTDRLGESGEIGLSIQQLRTGKIQDLELKIDRWHEGVGEPDVLGSLGIVQQILPVVGGVAEDTPAARAGLRADDWIVQVDDRPLSNWQQWVKEIESHPNQNLRLTLVRDGREQIVDVTPAAREKSDGTTIGSLGVYASVVEVQRGPLQAIPLAMDKTWDNTVMTVSIIKKMLFGQVSVKNLSGPISIAQVAGDSAKYSWRSFVTILGFLSISLGVLNLLPVPILDGGQVVYHSAEWVMGKPVPESIQVLGVQVGLLLVGTMLVFATYNDILRLFS